MPGFSDPPPGASGSTLQSQSEASEEHRTGGRAPKLPDTRRQVHKGHQNHIPPSDVQRSLNSQLARIREEDLFLGPCHSTQTYALLCTWIVPFTSFLVAGTAGAQQQASGPGQCEDELREPAAGSIGVDEWQIWPLWGEFSSVHSCTGTEPGLKQQHQARLQPPHLQRRRLSGRET